MLILKVLSGTKLWTVATSMVGVEVDRLANDDTFGLLPRPMSVSMILLDALLARRVKTQIMAGLCSTHHALLERVTIV